MLVPTRSLLFTVLEIVEHFLKNLYIVDNVANSLDTVIRTYVEFERLVWKLVKTMEPGQEKSMRETLGKHVRRLGNQLPEMEILLVDAVTAGRSQTVKLGRTGEIEGQQVQYYMRSEDEEFNLSEFPNDF